MRTFSGSCNGLFSKKALYLIFPTSISNKLFFAISYIGLWTPKIFYYDNVEFFPLINLIFDLTKYSIKYSALLF